MFKEAVQDGILNVLDGLGVQIDLHFELQGEDQQNFSISYI